MRILIPAYKPDENLINLIKAIRERSAVKILIVDDGSGENCFKIFDQALSYGCTIIQHPVNMGKGEALKTGFRYLLENGEAEGVVCADSDGQHSAEDILRIAAETIKSDRIAVLGSRQFTEGVPFKSRFGNIITRTVFTAASGYRISDTQTGLRGYPASMLEWLCSVEGSRYEYEMNVLLKLKSSGYFVKEIAIETIYLDRNKKSHFRPIIDSFRVYLPFLSFTASSIISGCLDFGLLLLFDALFGSLFPAVVLSRTISSVFNYACNRRMVFKNKVKIGVSAVKYFSLVLVIMLLNYMVLNALHTIGLPLAAAKILTETILFMFSYVIQKRLVFI